LKKYVLPPSSSSSSGNTSQKTILNFKVKMVCGEDDLKAPEVTRWSTRADDREEWTVILKEAMVKL
jgi:hypothetical protein